MRVAILTVLLASGCLAFSSLEAQAPAVPPVHIRPGAVWRDNRGEPIQAHGAGMIKVGRFYYWFGEDHTGEASDQSFVNINCYRSDDLAHWQFQGNALTRQDAPGDLGPGRVVERPKVIYNEASRTFVMYAHIDDRENREAKVGVATCDRVDGSYAYRGSFRPLERESRDLTLFKDEDGRAYLVSEDRPNGLRIAPLADDFLTLAGEGTLVPRACEAPAMVKVRGVYYLLVSHLTGWEPNVNEYATADSPLGPWSEFQPVAPRDTNTYRSQTAYILPVTGTRETSYIYLGDRWQEHNLKDSRYVWMPLRIDPARRTMVLSPDEPWTIDAAAGFCSLPVAPPTVIR